MVLQVCTRGAAIYPSMSGVSVHYLLHSFSLVCSLWICVCLQRAPLRAGGEEREECPRASNTPKGSRSVQMREGVNNGHTLQCWKLVGNNATFLEQLQSSLWFHPLKLKKCHSDQLRISSEKQRSEKRPQSPALQCIHSPHLFFLLCRSIFFLFRIIS